MVRVRFCGICGSPRIGPHCATRACNWWKCRDCGALGDVEGLAVIESQPKET